jgi:hypothetical protein
MLRNRQTLGLLIAVLVCLVSIALQIGPQLAQTGPANVDDADFARDNTNPEITRKSELFDLGIGRFYAPVKYAVIGVFYSPKFPGGIGCVRIIMIAAQIGLLSLLVARLFSNPYLGWLNALVLAACIQLSPTYHPDISYPQLGLGVILLILSLLAWLSALDRPSGKTRALSLGLWFLACVMHEFFLPLCALHMVFSRRACIPWKKSITLAIPFLAVGLVYAFAYFSLSSFGRAHGVQWHGNTLSFAPGEIINCAVVYTAGSLPGIEPFLDRWAASPGLPLRSFSGVFSLLQQNLGLPELLTGLLLGVCSAVLALKSATQPKVHAVKAAFITLLCLPLPSVLLFISQRSQVWAHHRVIPYTYSYYEIYFYLLAFLLLSLAWISCGVKTSFRSSLLRASVFGLACCVLYLLCLTGSREALTNIAAGHTVTY